MVLVGAPVIYPRAFFKVRAQILFKVPTAFSSTNCISVSVQPVLLIPQPQIFHADILCTPKGPMVSDKILHQLLAVKKWWTIFIYNRSCQEDIIVFNPFTNIQIGCDFQIPKHSNCYITHHVDHSGSLMIKLVDTRRPYFYKFFLSCR